MKKDIILLSIVLLIGFAGIAIVFWASNERENYFIKQLQRETEDKLHYRALWLKANTHIADLKENCIYYAKKK